MLCSGRGYPFESQFTIIFILLILLFYPFPALMCKVFNLISYFAAFLFCSSSYKSSLVFDFHDPSSVGLKLGERFCRQIPINSIIVSH
jgi:hypothetical protein